VSVRIVEVGPRDGLQNERETVPTIVKIELVERLVAAGLNTVEITSFVRADRIPQLADAAEVARGVHRAAGVRYLALAPNVRGLRTAIECGIDEVAVFVAVSETFNRHNVNRTVAESLEDARQVVDVAHSNGVRTRAYVSTVAGCPYEGQVAPDSVVALAARLFELGCDELSLGDTIGVGRPAQIAALIERVAAVSDLSQLAFHGHDTYGMGVANALAAIEVGVGAIDSSVGGLGGCPFAGPQAKGNLATEDLVYALQGTPNDTGIDLAALCDISQWMAGYLGHPPASSVARAAMSDGPAGAT
jgi:hydroxymethylglutaryl-CoA lyase